MAKLAPCKLCQGFALPCCERDKADYLLLPPAKRKTHQNAKHCPKFNDPTTWRGPCLPGRSADFSEGAGTTVRTQRPKGSTDTIGLESLWQAPGQISSKKFCTLIYFQQKNPTANFHCKLSATRRAKSDPDIHSASEGAQEVGPNVIPGFLRLEAAHWMWCRILPCRQQETETPWRLMDTIEMPTGPHFSWTYLWLRLDVPYHAL